MDVTDEMVEAGARAAAIHQDYDGCFERLDAWAALEQWERDAHPEEEPTDDAEDAQWWRDRIRIALTAALALPVAHRAPEAVEHGESESA